MSATMNGWSRRYNGYLNKLFGGKANKTEVAASSDEAKQSAINEKNAKLMQADYTRKTMALAEERKAMKRERDEMMAKMALMQEKLDTYERREKEVKI